MQMWSLHIYLMHSLRNRETHSVVFSWLMSATKKKEQIELTLPVGCSERKVPHQRHFQLVHEQVAHQAYLSNDQNLCNKNNVIVNNEDGKCTMWWLHIELAFLSAAERNSIFNQDMQRKYVLHPTLDISMQQNKPKIANTAYFDWIVDA